MKKDLLKKLLLFTILYPLLKATSVYLFLGISAIIGVIISLFIYFFVETIAIFHIALNILWYFLVIIFVANDIFLGYFFRKKFLEINRIYMSAVVIMSNFLFFLFFEEPQFVFLEKKILFIIFLAVIFFIFGTILFDKKLNFLDILKKKKKVLIYSMSIIAIGLIGTITFIKLESKKQIAKEKIGLENAYKNKTLDTFCKVGKYRTTLINADGRETIILKKSGNDWSGKYEAIKYDDEKSEETKFEKNIIYKNEKFFDKETGKEFERLKNFKFYFQTVNLKAKDLQGNSYRLFDFGHITTDYSKKNKKLIKGNYQNLSSSRNYFQKYFPQKSNQNFEKNKIENLDFLFWESNPYASYLENDYHLVED